MFPLCAEDEIKALNGKIEKAEKKVEALELKEVDASDPGFNLWMLKFTAACDKEKQLRDEKLLLLNKQAPQGMC
jgi:hypothetical protein